MNSGVLNYQLQTFTGFISHGWGSPLFLRDTADEVQTYVDRQLEVQVRSGDYFVTLATTLDTLGRNIDDYYIRADLEDIVSDLITLQDSYTIIKK